MPQEIKSESQRRSLWADKPVLAYGLESNTPPGKKLPEKVGERPQPGMPSSEMSGAKVGEILSNLNSGNSENMGASAGYPGSQQPNPQRVQAYLRYLQQG